MIILFLFLIGISLGSFATVLIDRLSQNRKITGRSKCDFCRKKLAWYDLFPILSFLILRGRSRCCGNKLSIYYPFVEFIMGLVFVISWIYIPFDNLFYKTIALGLLFNLIVIFFADVKYMIIPDQILISLLVVSIPFFLINIFNHLLAAVILCVIFYFLFFITRGRGLGFGDVKFAFVIGFLQGIELGFLSIYLSFILGGIFATILLFLKKKNMKSKIAFGPFLVLGVIISLFFPQLVRKVIFPLW